MKISGDIDLHDRMVIALLMIARSWHTDSLRMGAKAEMARWGLGERNAMIPESYQRLLDEIATDPPENAELRELLIAVTDPEPA